MRAEATGELAARSHSAAFELSGDAREGWLRLLSPLGTVVAQARWSPAGVQLQSDGGPRDYPSLDALAEDALGEALPLAALPDWLRGRPWDGAPSQPRADGFEQLGWQVDTQGLAREGLLLARRSQPSVIQLRVRLDS